MMVKERNNVSKQISQNGRFLSRSALKIQLVTSTQNFAEKSTKPLNRGKIHRENL